MSFDLTGKIIWILVFAGVMTIWTMFGQAYWNNWLVTQGYSTGIGETYIGYILPGVITLIFTGLLLRRTRGHDN